jgi:membrane protein required for colicin V production
VNWLDYVFLFVLFVSVYKSFRKGFIREVIGLGATILGLLCGMWFYGTAGAYLEPTVHSERTANLLGFILVFVLVIGLGVIVGRSIAGVVRSIGLSFVDRFMGAVVGLVRGLVVCIALLIAFTSYGPRQKSGSLPGAVLNSQIAPWILRASDYGVSLAPMELKRTFRGYYAEVKGVLKQSKF